MNKVACAALAALLAGCQATPSPSTQTVEVEKLVRVPCIEKKPVRPVYQTGRGEEPSGAEKSRILIKDFETAEQYGYAWEAAASGCMIAPSSSK